jgi:hypothetical protein
MTTTAKNKDTAQGETVIVPPEVKAGDEVFYYSHEGIFTATVVNPAAPFEIVATDKKGDAIYETGEDGTPTGNIKMLPVIGVKLRVVKNWQVIAKKRKSS